MNDQWRSDGLDVRLTRCREIKEAVQAQLCCIEGDCTVIERTKLTLLRTSRNRQQRRLKRLLAIRIGRCASRIRVVSSSQGCACTDPT